MPESVECKLVASELEHLTSRELPCRGCQRVTLSPATLGSDILYRELLLTLHVLPCKGCHSCRARHQCVCGLPRRDSMTDSLPTSSATVQGLPEGHTEPCYPVRRPGLNHHKQGPLSANDIEKRDVRL